MRHRCALFHECRLVSASGRTVGKLLLSSSITRSVTAWGELEQWTKADAYCTWEWGVFPHQRRQVETFSQLPPPLFWKCFLGRLKVKSSADWRVFGIYNRKDTERDKCCASPLVSYPSAAWPCIQKWRDVSYRTGIRFFHQFLLLTSQQAYVVIVRAPELDSVRRRLPGPLLCNSVIFQVK